MNKGHHQCSNCSFELDLEHEAFAFCDVCQLAKLCPQCVISAEIVPMCLDCQKTQMTEWGERESKLQKMSRCPICSSIYNVKKPCQLCKKEYCNKCDESIHHTCFKCFTQNCSRRFFHRCCEENRCVPCHARHKGLDCKLTMYIRCKKCNKEILAFGPNAKKCPVSTCTSVAGCPHCINTIKSTKGIYCRWHTSAAACGGCNQRYPLDSALGYGCLKILILLGAKTHVRHYCGTCLQKVKALVESSLIVIKRAKLVFPKVLMDKIVLFASLPSNIQ